MSRLLPEPSGTESEKAVSKPWDRYESLRSLVLAEAHAQLTQKHR